MVMCMKVNGLTIWVTVLVFSFKLMVQNSKDNLRRISNKALELRSGVTELNTEVTT